MTELFETCRDVNLYLAFVVFLWLVWRTVRAWPAEWAKPDHVGHYRSLLLLGSGFLLGVTFAAFLYARVDNVATSADPASTLMCLFAASICWYWPKPRAMRKEPSS